MFERCEICGANSWNSITYEGSVRSGSFGTRTEGGKVARCGGCGVDRLAESVSISSSSYESDSYRIAMEQGLEIEDFFAHADPVQIHNISAFWPLDLRGKVIADIGCGAGSFISHVSGLAEKIIAIEPTERYHSSLSERGYAVFSYATDALKVHPEGVDIAVTFQVIEHVLNPRAFLTEIAALLKPGGTLLIATPNRDDVLTKLLPEEFLPFFYRAAHRWYFDRESLRYCVEAVDGLQVESELYLHTYGMSNALSWMKERRPTGSTRLPGINNLADQLWRSYLDASGQADTLYVLARKSS
jgi:2-polyprenyl-3-methyl-5-hydroxy-6-metoxy-1,4-benzoquinol methylase